MSLGIDLAALKRQTILGIRSGKVALSARLDEEAKRKLEKEEEARKRAEVILNDLPVNCKSAAEKGLDKAFVLRLEYGFDYHHPPGVDSRVLRPEWLRGAAAIVYATCDEMGLHPVIRWGHDGQGVKDWFDLLVDISQVDKRDSPPDINQEPGG